MEKKSKLYVAYGSNMNLYQMSHRCPKAKVLGVGELKNYKLTFRGRRRGVANVEPSHSGSIPIVLWQISEECEKSLDHYEGFPRLYIKIDVQVEYNGESMEAMAYVMAEPYCNISNRPENSYVEIIKEGYEQNGIADKVLLDAVRKTYEELHLGND